MTAGRAGLLVVGASQAGVQLASRLRELGYSSPIRLIGEETHPPYQRPPLSKALLTGAATAESLTLRNAEYYRDQRITVTLGERVGGVEFSGGGSGIARASSGARYPFDRLVLATGARPRRLDLPGADADGVLYLRDLDSALRLRDRLSRARVVVVVGGGFIGLEAAATARAQGRQVAVVEAGPQLMGRALGAPTASYLLDAHRAAGIDFHLGTAPRRIVTADGAATGVELADGIVLDADVVLVGVGVVPRDELARAAGLDCADGVVVDRRSLASDGVTVAVGDCANLPDPTPGAAETSRLRLESVDNAVEQANAAAWTVLGEDRTYRSVPWFWSDQGAFKLQIAGLRQLGDDALVRPGAKPGRRTTLYYRGDRLVAAECVNAPADFLQVKKALADERHPPRAVVADPSVPLKSILADASALA
ncbi:NAD(P)/FAD-dependent oxidoreductase [Cryptosporangium minutisporangium]|uniref:FAD-dependent oxidoreductase n=1 Tax=Cryptosporangium minutisporangium TaxID=113569 RepID=A0ABP6ST10_9ACTN